MRKLFLVQHGKSFSQEQDPARGLTPQGRAEAERLAAQLHDGGMTLDKILHSGKARAAQTAEIFAAALHPPQGIEAVTGLAPNDPVAPFANDSLPGDPAVMIVGHLPFLEKLCAELLTGKQDPLPVKFHNAGVVCLSQPSAGVWVLNWTLVPDLKV